MPSADQLANWIGRTRDSINPANPPKLNVTDTVLAAPWLSDAILEVHTECADDEDRLQALTDACEHALLAAGDDVSARFFVLHLYYWLERFAEPETSWDEDAAEVQNRIANAFGHLVSLASVGGCRREWPIVRWEISNAYAARRWGRAVELYEFAEREASYLSEMYG